MSDMAAGPLFIASMWRGGSSLFYVLLNKHPQVALTYEADLLLVRPLFVKPDFLIRWPERWDFWNQALSRHELNPGDFAEVSRRFTSAFEAVHRAYAQRKGAIIWGDKSPNYHDELVSMARAFPKARFIIVWRSPLETISAAQRAAANGSRYFRKRGTALRSLLGHRILQRQCAQLVAAGVPVHQLHYEELISNTEAVMRRACGFLEIPYHDSLRRLEGADRSPVYEGKHHDLLRGDRIVSKPRPDVISPRLRRKIERHLRFWQSADERNPNRDEIFSEPILHGVERKIDWVRYRFYRSFDSFIRCCFCFLPIPVLRGYRAWRDRREARQFSGESLNLSTRENTQ